MYKGNLGRDFYGYYISALDTAITLEFIELAQYSRYGVKLYSTLRQERGQTLKYHTMQYSRYGVKQ